MRAIDLSGQKFGRLVAKEPVFTAAGRRWACECECGNIVPVRASSLKNGRTQSCGCLQREHRRVFGESVAIKHGVWDAIPGARFGRLLVIDGQQKIVDGEARWACECECGKKLWVRTSGLRSGRSTSCGCLRSDSCRDRLLTHGHSAGGVRTPEHAAWSNMRNRCYNVKVDSYPRYGGRGITVCDRWIDSFENFLADMGPRPSPTHSIDRIDVDGNYEPSNCRWATRSEQARNKRKGTSRNGHVSLGGHTLLARGDHPAL